MLFACWPTAAVAQIAPSLTPGAAYAAVVTTYSADPLKAIRELAAWSRAQVDRGIKQFPETPAGSRLLDPAATPHLLERLALLHAETAFAHYNRGDGETMGTHLEWSRRFVRHALPWPAMERRPGSGPDALFHTRWVLTIAGFFHNRLAFAEARRFLDEELQASPAHALLLLARGITEEIAASERALANGAAAVRSSRFSGTRVLLSPDQIARPRRAALESAAVFYRRAAAADASVHEARLRLGRVLFDLGDDAAAQQEFEQIGMLRLRPDHEYLLSLFLAAVHERSLRPDEAAGHYRRAATLFPAAQAPYLGLSRLQALRDPEAAGEMLRQMFALTVAPTASAVPDPWWLYDAGFGATLPARLKMLRAEVRGQ
jgi:tetratricopeptide (TPR) repeat protein